MSSSRGADVERVLATGGVVLFGADTVYGLACDPACEEAIRRVYALKERAAEKPSAQMWFSRAGALAALGELGPRTRAALERILPGPVTLVLAGGLGVRVPVLPDGSPLAAVRRPVLQTSANLAGSPEARRLKEVPASIRRGVDLALDAGELPGLASTVVDLRLFEVEREWRVLREGAVSGAALARVLGAAP